MKAISYVSSCKVRNNNPKLNLLQSSVTTKQYFFLFTLSTETGPNKSIWSNSRGSLTVLSSIFLQEALCCLPFLHADLNDHAWNVWKVSVQCQFRSGSTFQPLPLVSTADGDKRLSLARVLLVFPEKLSMFTFGCCSKLSLISEVLVLVTWSQDQLWLVSIGVTIPLYVNGMKSRKKNQSANVPKSANQRKHKPRVWKPKKVGSKERLASPKPSTPTSCLRWSPTGRVFDLKGKIIATSESECQPDCSKGDNACTSNPQEPIIQKVFQV
ncbi:hypothetical protein Tco_0524736 [Tanacetum coccineum]